MSDVGAVFFDAVFTLIRPDPPSPQVYAETALRYGLAADPAVLAAALKLLWQEHRARKRETTIVRGTSEAFEKEWWRTLVRSAFAAATGTPCSDECFEEIFARYGTADAWRAAPHAHETLEAVRARGLVTGVISNYDARLPGVLTALGLMPLLDAVVWSADAGWEKPDAPIFRTAARRAGVPAVQCLHVGDDLEADVRGALAAGFQAVWLVSGGASVPPDAAALADPPAPVIHGLAEVLEFLPPR